MIQAICYLATNGQVDNLLSVHTDAHMPNVHKWSCDVCFQASLYSWRLFSDMELDTNACLCGDGFPLKSCIKIKIYKCGCSERTFTGHYNKLKIIGAKRKEKKRSQALFIIIK